MMQDSSAGRHGPSLVIYGLARNVAPGLAADLAVIDDIQRSVPGSISIIVTNDNNDETATILQAWSGRDPARELIVPNGISAAVPDRIDRMAVLRNLALARVREVRRPHHTHLLVLDMDGPNRLISGDGISDLLAGWRPEWDAVFANQRQAYYDLYALRHPAWCATDCLVELAHESNRQLFRKDVGRALAKVIYQRQYRIPANTAPIEVSSAFGGLGLYRMDSLEGCWYGSRDANGATVCEHVVLHRQMRERGARLFILPSLLNDAPTEHTGRTSGRDIPPHLLRATMPQMSFARVG